MLTQLSHIRSRRAALMKQVDLARTFEQWEETCVPSYCHSNWLAAYVSWTRLFQAVKLARRTSPHPRRVLDFGSSVGELGQLVRDDVAQYEFIEQDEQAASFLLENLPEATRRMLSDAPDGEYDWVFAVDSLEHNDNYAHLLECVLGKLSDRGVLILSGPTESSLYRLGRRLAGFRGGYHTTNIYAIEQEAAKLAIARQHVTILPGFPLFRLSAWSLAEKPVPHDGSHQQSLSSAAC